MKVDNQDVKVIFEFSPRHYFLVENTKAGLEDERFSLNPRIDRSDKGKDDDVGTPVIYLTEEDAAECEKVGFTKVIMNV